MRYSVPTKWQSDNILSKQHQSEMEEVHAVCFAKLCEVIDREIIIGKKVMKMTDLRSLYRTYLSETPFANPNYRSEKIKSILNNHEVYSNKLCFVCLVKSRVNISQILFLVTKLIFQKLLSMSIYWDVQIRFRM